MRQAYPTAHAPDTVFCRAGRPLRDETVAIWDELDGRPHTNCPLTASYGGVSLIHRRRDVMTRIATSMLLLGGLAGLAVAGAAGARKGGGGMVQTPVGHHKEKLANPHRAGAPLSPVGTTAPQGLPPPAQNPPPEWKGQQ